MKKEILRQSIHLIGILFILIAQFLTRSQSALMFFMITMIFLAYSQYVQISKNHVFGLRRFMFKFERGNEKRPFTGAIWFYAGCFLTFVLFPLHIASVSCAILAIGDAFATLIGKGYGKHKICGNKTAEGFLAFVVGSYLIALFWIKPWLALIGAGVGGYIEICVSSKRFRKLESKWWFNDNWIIPLLVGFVLFVISSLNVF